MRTAGKVLLSSCLLSACTAPTIPIPTAPSSPESRPADPSEAAQRRLLTEAQRAFEQERYAAAVLFLRRFIGHAPSDSAEVAEARWRLGQALEHVGDHRAAMEEYRLLVTGPSSLPQIEQDALRRLDELRQRRAGRTGRHLALRLGADQLPPAHTRAAWFNELAASGVTALVIALESTGLPHEPMAGASSLVAEAHQVAIEVWLSMDLHAPQPWIRSEWTVGTITVEGQKPAGRRPDVAHPGYQDAVEDLVRTLSTSGCDGVFLMMRTGPGFSTEFSEESFTAFAAAFGVGGSAAEVLSGRSEAQDSPDYWRWVGWKASAYAKLAGRLQKVLRERHPTAMLLVEVHPQTLLDPVTGLEQYGENILELAQRTVGAIVVRHDDPGVEPLIDRLGLQLGATDRVWVEIPGGSNEPLRAMQAMDRTILGRRHTILTPQAPAPVP